MSGFKPGWWAVNRRKEGDVEAWYFQNRTQVTATALLLSNGDQILYFRPSAEKPHLLETWQPRYEWLPVAPAGDRWDNDQYGAEVEASMALPEAFSRASRQPSAQELAGRVGKADLCKAEGLSCEREIHVGVFFDGTNNNMKRDREGVGHSNIVSLYDSHRFDEIEYFRYYIPGVGTPFPEIGELGEDSKGKAMARGGEARIHYALIMLYNAVARSVTSFDLVSDDETKNLVNDIWWGLKTIYRSDNKAMIRVFRNLDQRLMERVRNKRPLITRLHLSVFGFSRGAAEARTFANWVEVATRGKIGPAQLTIRFLGLYDTVASVLLADSSPIGGGFLDWANQTMRIPTGVEQTVHYCAGHEIRRSFPLSTLRMGGDWPAQSKEFVYPGAHSDIGGGYSPQDQGKARGGRADLLSQIPLNDMYFEAVNGGVKLSPLTELDAAPRQDYQVSPALQSAFSAYLHWTPADEKGENLSGSRRGHMEGRMRTQIQHYWRWRAKYSNDADFRKLRSWANANAQDRVDLEEGNKDWQVDLQRAYAVQQPRTVAVPFATGPVSLNLPARPSQTQRDLVAAVDDKRAIPADVDRFFDDYVHDSHAGFWMLGPITRMDKAIFVNEIRRRNAMRERHLALAQNYNAVGQYEEAAGAYLTAQRYTLNRFEQQVLQLNPTNVDVNKAGEHVNVPLMRDTDAPDLRENHGFEGTVVKHIVGTATRREPNGAGQYRQVMDRDHESVLQPVEELGYQLGRVTDAAKRKGQGIIDDISDKAADIKKDVEQTVDRAVESAVNAGKEAIKRAIQEGAKRVIPSGQPRL